MAKSIVQMRPDRCTACDVGYAALQYTLEEAKRIGYDVTDLAGNLATRADLETTISEKAPIFFHAFGHGNECYSEDTEVLTENGWKFFPDLEDGEKVATLNPESDELEYQIPIRFFKYPYVGKMFYQKGKAVDLLVTPNHNLWVSWMVHGGRYAPFTFLKPTELGNGVERDDKGRFVSTGVTNGKLKFKRDAKWKGQRREWFYLPSVAVKYGNQYAGNTFAEKVKPLLSSGLTQSEIANKVSCSEATVSRVKTGKVKGYRRAISEKKILMDDWLCFFGIWIAEGSVSSSEKGHYVISVTQNDDRKRERIKPWIQTVTEQIGCSMWEEQSNPHSKAIKFKNKQMYEYLKKFGKAKDKYIPKELKELESRQLKILLKTMVFGDGTTKGNNIHYSSASKRLADDVQEIALKLGYGATISKSLQNKNPLYNVSITTKYINHLCAKDGRGYKDYSGYIYSVEVPNHLLYVRRNGKPCWSGNSTFTGQNTEVVLKVGVNEELCAGMIVYLLSCLTGVELGPAIINAGGWAYIGYTVKWTWMDEDGAGDPYLDKYAKGFFEGSNAIVFAFLNGFTAKEAWQAGYNKYTAWIDYWAASDDPHASECVHWLTHDRDNCVLFGDVGAGIEVVRHFLTVNSEPTGVPFNVDLMEGVTPWSGELAEGKRTVTMPSRFYTPTAIYGFDHWEDGSTSRTRTINLTADMMVTAYYVEVPSHTLTVNSDPVSGIEFTINDAIGFTPYSELLEEGTYTITVPSRAFVDGVAYDFLHWEDGSTELIRTVSLASDLTVTAFYEEVPTYLLSVDSEPFDDVPFTIDGTPYSTPSILRRLRDTYIVSFPTEIEYNGEVFTFKVWENGSTDPTRTVDLTADTKIIGYYTAHTLTVKSTPINGVPVTVDEYSAGVTPISTPVAEGSHVISVPEEVEV